MDGAGTSGTGTSLKKKKRLFYLAGRVLAFALFGGKPSNDRFARTGRVDLQVEELDETGPIDLQWEVVPV